TGESAVVRCPKCAYAANVEKAQTRKLPAVEATATSGSAERKKVSTPGKSSVEDVAAFLGVEPRQVVKTLIYDTEKGLVAVVVRGDREINEVKLGNYLDVEHLGLAAEEKVREATGAAVGYAGPVGLPQGVRLIGDETVRGLADFVVGANEAGAHYTGVNWGKDVDLAEWADLLLVSGGDPCPRCDATLELFRGIEVGHIFKLGAKYSEAMACNFTDEAGADRPMIMGCYGLGIGRTVAAAIEQNHDKDGIIWPRPLAPFEVLLAGLNPDDAEVSRVAEELYAELRGQGVDVLYDDRDERPGVKFKDADLIGIPVRLVIGAKSLKDGKVELSLRRDREKLLVPPGEAVRRVLELLG
ncbi:MAG TPA: proline--tRNA ligase, partial [Thermoanaerobaculia bacterium]|nr:proline--tRNA ligase [Thermoanaerobaculia bacterium]